MWISDSKEVMWLAVLEMIFLVFLKCNLKIRYTGAPGWLGPFSVWFLNLAQVMISWFVGWSLTSGPALH